MLGDAQHAPGPLVRNVGQDRGDRQVDQGFQTAGQDRLELAHAGVDECLFLAEIVDQPVAEGVSGQGYGGRNQLLRGLDRPSDELEQSEQLHDGTLELELELDARRHQHQMLSRHGMNQLRESERCTVLVVHVESPEAPQPIGLAPPRTHAEIARREQADVE